MTPSCSFRSPHRCAGPWSPTGSTASPGTASPATRSPTWSRNRAAETDMAIAPDEKLRFPRLGRDPASVRQRVEAMEKVLERLFVIPGTKRHVGLDVILDLVPVVGDLTAAALGAYI